MGKISIISSSSPLSSSSSNVDYLINKEAIGTTIPFVPTQFKNVGERRGRLLEHGHLLEEIRISYLHAMEAKDNLRLYGLFCSKADFTEHYTAEKRSENKVKWREKVARSVAPEWSP